MMKRFLNIFLISCGIVLGSLSHGFALVDGIIAIVNEDIITLQDLREYLRGIYIQLKAAGKDEVEIQEIMQVYEQEGLKRLIEDRLLVAAADELGLEIRNEMVDEKLEKMKERYSSEEEFLTGLAAEGLTITDLRKRIADQAKAKYIVEVEVRQKISVNPQDVTDYYNLNVEQFQKPERVDLDSIFIEYGDDEPQAREKASQALTRIKAGESFQDIANEYSASPSIGMMEKGQLLPVLEDIIFNLQEGEVSSLVEIENGIYIFKLKQKHPTEIAPLEEVRDNIYNFLFRKAFKERFESWMGKLRERSYVEIKN